jgi:hypothetical protein
LHQVVVKLSQALRDCEPVGLELANRRCGQSIEPLYVIPSSWLDAERFLKPFRLVASRIDLLLQRKIPSPLTRESESITGSKRFSMR